MRQRVEDLGRLAVLLDKMIDDPLWEVTSTGRTKDYADNFLNLSKDQQHEIIHKLAYGLRDMKEALYECLHIARGQDPLNEQAH